MPDLTLITTQATIIILAIAAILGILAAYAIAEIAAAPKEIGKSTHRGSKIPVRGHTRRAH